MPPAPSPTVDIAPRPLNSPIALADFAVAVAVVAHLALLHHQKPGLQVVRHKCAWQVNMSWDAADRTRFRLPCVAIPASLSLLLTKWQW